MRRGAGDDADELDLNSVGLRARADLIELRRYQGDALFRIPSARRSREQLRGVFSSRSWEAGRNVDARADR
jgi:hypothetical protein